MDRARAHGLQTPELAYARAGTAWHRAEAGTAFIPNGDLCVTRGRLPGRPSPQPSPTGRGGKSGRGTGDEEGLARVSGGGRGRVGIAGICRRPRSRSFWDDEIRYYYAGTNVRGTRGTGSWSRRRPGLGMARLKPDRFVALRAGEAPAELGTIAFKPPSVDVFVNARTAADGEVRVELQDAEARPLAGVHGGGLQADQGQSDGGTEWSGAAWGQGRSAGGPADAHSG